MTTPYKRYDRLIIFASKKIPRLFIRSFAFPINNKKVMS